MTEKTITEEQKEDIRLAVTFSRTHGLTSIASLRRVLLANGFTPARATFAVRHWSDLAKTR